MTESRKMWRLGLDMGTDSIGWAAIELQGGEPTGLLDMGVRIFNDGRDPQTYESLNLNRRTARLMRRQKYRRLRRQKLIKNLLIRHGYFPEEPEKQEELKLLNPYVLRKKALDEKLEKYELGRVLLHLAGHRGFKSNRKTDAQDKEMSELKKKMSALEEYLKTKNYRTLGDYLYEEKLPKDYKEGVGKPFPQGPEAGLRFRPESSEFFPTRSLYEHEWDTIRQVQEKFHHDLPWDKVREKTYHQRPLKSQARGLCFYTRQKRAWKFLPTMQRFRIYQEVNNLKYWEVHENTRWRGETKTLTLEQKQLLAECLDGVRDAKVSGKRNQMYLSWAEIKKILGLKDKNYEFNLEKEPQRREGGLLANWIAYTLKKPEYFGDGWSTLTDDEQDNIVKKLYVEHDEGKLREYLKNWVKKEHQLQALLDFNVGLSTTASVSLKFARDVLVYLRQGLIYREAAEKAGYSFKTNEGFEDGTRAQLPYYGEILWDVVVNRGAVESEDEDELKKEGDTQKPSEEKPSEDDPNYLKNAIEYYGRIGNPTVHIALNQLRKLVNKLIQRFGKPAEIVVEMGRDLKATKKKRDDISKKNAQQKKENDRIRKELREKGFSNPSSWDIKKYKLWEELGRDQFSRVCLYTGKTINLDKLFSDEVEIEHILPYSRTLNDGMSNLTVSYKHANAYKGNRTPWEAFHDSNDGYDWRAILERVKRVFNPIGVDRDKQKYFEIKRSRFEKDALENYKQGEEFIESQLTDNHYIARSTRRYLSAICPPEKIWHSVGSITAKYREVYGLNKILQKETFNNDDDKTHKNRSDHRHHALDAFVIALVDRSVLQRVNTLHAQNRLGMKDFEAWKKVLPKPPSWINLQEKIKNIVPSLRVNHKLNGQFFMETALGHPRVIQGVNVLQLSDYLDLKNERDLEFIVSKKIRNEFKELYAVHKNTDKVLQELSKMYTVIYINQPLYVSRSSTAMLKDENKLNLIYDPVVLKAWKDFSSLPGEKRDLQQFFKERNIKHLRTKSFSQEACEVPSAPYKFYCLSDFLFVDVWFVPEHRSNGKKQSARYQGVFVSRWDALREKLKKVDLSLRKPHPAAKKKGRYYKDDVLYLIPKDKTSEPIWVKVKGFSTTDNKMDIYPIYVSDELVKWVRNVPEPLLPKLPKFLEKYKGYSREKKIPQNFISINVLFQDFEVQKVFVDVDGEVKLPIHKT